MYEYIIRYCDKCNKKAIYNKEYYSFYCTSCKIWLPEEKCSDELCEICKELESIN